MTPSNQSGESSAAPLKPHKRMDHVFAIVRVDAYPGLDVPDEERITIKKILRDAEAAGREVERLNGLNKGKARYFLQVTRLETQDCPTPAATGLPRQHGVADSEACSAAAAPSLP
jgi:hypothetical protein